MVNKPERTKPKEKRPNEQVRTNRPKFVQAQGRPFFMGTVTLQRLYVSLHK